MKEMKERMICGGCGGGVSSGILNNQSLCDICADQLNGLAPSFTAQKTKRIAYISDVHTDHYSDVFQPVEEICKNTEFLEADILIIAGDLGSLDQVPEILSYISGRLNTVEIMFVAGNHEFYGQAIWDVHKLKNRATPSNVHILNRDFWHQRLGASSDLLIVGSVGWIDGSWGSPYGKKFYKSRYNDFRMIKGFNRQGLEYGKADHRAMDKLLSTPASHKIAVTHMLPNQECIETKHLGDPLNHCYANNWNLHSKRQVDAWIFGHSHCNFNRTIDGCKFLSRGAGYPSEPGCNLMPDIYEVPYE